MFFLGPPNFPFYCHLLNQSIDRITVRCTSEKYTLNSNDNNVNNNEQYQSSAEMQTNIDNNNDNEMHQRASRKQKIVQTIFVHPTTYYIAEVYDKHGHLLKNITLNPPMPFSNISNIDLSIILMNLNLFLKK